MQNNSADFGGFEQAVDNITPVILGFIGTIGLIIFIVTVILYGIKYLKYKTKDVLLLKCGFTGGAAITVASLILKLILNYNLFANPKIEIPICLVFILIGVAIISLAKR